MLPTAERWHHMRFNSFDCQELLKNVIEVSRYVNIDTGTKTKFIIEIRLYWTFGWRGGGQSGNSENSVWQILIKKLNTVVIGGICRALQELDTPQSLRCLPLRGWRTRHIYRIIRQWLPPSFPPILAHSLRESFVNYRHCLVARMSRHSASVS